MKEEAVTNKKQTVIDRWLWAIYSHAYDGLLLFWPYEHLLDLMKHEIGPVDGLRVLDLGCGTGNLLWNLAKESESFSAVGTDFSQAMLKVARKKLLPNPKTSKIELVEADILNFLSQQPSSEFDKIFSVNVLYAINDQATLWKEMLRVLKPNGTITVTTSVRTGSGPIIKEHLRHKSFLSLLKPRLIGVFIVDSLINMLGNVGKYSFSNERELRICVSDAGGKWHNTIKCYGGEDHGVNILFQVTH